MISITPLIIFFFFFSLDGTPYVMHKVPYFYYDPDLLRVSNVFSRLPEKRYHHSSMLSSLELSILDVGSWKLSVSV